MAAGGKNGDRVDLKRFAWLQEEAVRLRREADRASGEREGLLGRLADEFGVATEAEARKLLRQMEAEEAEARDAFAAARVAWEKKWADKLGEGE